LLAVEGDVGSNIEKLEDWLETLDKLLLLLAFTASAYWTVLKLFPSIYFILLAVKGDVGNNIEKLEDWLYCQCLLDSTKVSRQHLLYFASC
jgi:hypothetical protein